MRAFRRRMTYSNVAATIALFLALGGGAFAVAALKKNSVKSKQIAPGAVKESEIAGGAVTAGKLAPGLSTQGPQGPQGLQGPQGPQGPSGADIYDAPIPSGKSVSGLFILHEDGVTSGSPIRAVISLPLPASVPLEEATAGYGLGSAGGNAPTTTDIQDAVLAADEDPDCTGNAGTPMAPPGQLCLYVGGDDIVNVIDSFLRISSGTNTQVSTAFEKRSGASISATAEVAGTVDVRGVWMYTAP